MCIRDRFYELYKKYETDVEQYKFYAGLTTVSGPGIDIGLDDAQKKYESMSTFIVHDIYINEIINILRIAGAQAISVNGERIVAMSETLCLGPVSYTHLISWGSPMSSSSEAKSAKKGSFESKIWLRENKPSFPPPKKSKAS